MEHNVKTERGGRDLRVHSVPTPAERARIFVEIVAIAAKRLKNWSSAPNTTDGRRIVTVGKASRTAASPAALVRA